MTDERIKELEPRTGQRRVVVPSGRGRSGFRKAVGAAFTLAVGFLFSGTEFPGGAYPLGYALVAAVPQYSVFALLGVLLRCAYAYATGENLLLSAIGACTLCLFRVLLYVHPF